jgi:dTDP-4-dehydrorhamnose 3,5-epimerase-like enzyme
MSLGEVRWIDLPNMPDDRGTLTWIESNLDIPFEIRRLFFIHAARGERGLHAHRKSQQILMPVAGTFAVDVTNGSGSATHVLCDPNRGLFLPAMTWVRLYGFSPDAVCLVVADTYYADTEYIRDWKEFTAAIRDRSSV